MYKKVLEFERSMEALGKEIVELNETANDISSVFSSIVGFQKKIADLQQLTNSFPKALRQEMYIDLKHFSDALKGIKNTIFDEHIEQYLNDTQLTMMFMLNHPHLFLEDPDLQMSSLLETHDICRRLLGDIYIDAPNAKRYLDLCKNVSIPALEKKDILKALSQKIFSTIMKDKLDDIADRDDERKKEIVNIIKEKYPKASNSTRNSLLSKNKRATLQQDFLTYEKKKLDAMIEEESSALLSQDIHEIMRSFAIFLIVFMDDDNLDAMFSDYVCSFIENSLYVSHQSKIPQQATKTSSIPTFTPKFDPSKNATVSLKPLPDPLKNDIQAYFNVKKINGGCDRLMTIVEKILQKLLDNNKSVRKQRFVNKIASFGYNCIQEDFFAILEKHDIPCMDDTKPIQESGCVEDEQLPTDPAHNQEQKIEHKNDILIELEALDAIDRCEYKNKREYILKKVSGCADIFEKIGYTFENKEKFIEATTEYCLSNDRFYKELKKLLYDIVAKGIQEQRKEGKNYYTFNILVKRRIVLPQKGVISAILPHDMYQKYVKNNL